jgi:hypothetical protein
MTAQLFRRRDCARRRVGWVTSVLVVATMLGLASPVEAATPSSVALSIAEYAVATATHDRPAHVVSAADVSNAVEVYAVNSKQLYLLFNLDQVFGFSRVVLLFDEKPFSDICIHFPDSVGGVPRIIHCPRQAQGIWNSRPAVMFASGNAIAAAAARGQAVSGADVVKASAAYHLSLRPKPTFTAGQGATVKFATLVEMPPDAKFIVDICVRFPETAYGIPVQVAC